MDTEIIIWTETVDDEIPPEGNANEFSHWVMKYLTSGGR
jgi:hypothetical protein